MIVDDFDLPRAIVFPAKADSPLIVDSNAVLPTPLTADEPRRTTRQWLRYDDADLGHTCAVLDLFWRARARCKTMRCMARFHAAFDGSRIAQGSPHGPPQDRRALSIRRSGDRNFLA